MDIQRVLHRACRDFDGGYAMAGVTGYGASFVVRDPNGIRPAYYWANEEVVVVASERPAIRAAFGCELSEVNEIAEDLKINMIVMGSHGASGLKEFFVGFLNSHKMPLFLLLFDACNQPPAHNQAKAQQRSS